MKRSNFIVKFSPPGARYLMGDVPIRGSWPETAKHIIESIDPGAYPTGSLDFQLPKELDVARKVYGNLSDQGSVPVVSYRTAENPSVEALGTVPYYAVYVQNRVDCFDGKEVFEEQLKCGLPKPEGVLGHEYGCGISKRQMLKLHIRNPHKLPKRDIFLADIAPLIAPWQGIVVSSRLRQLLESSGCKGFSFLPISGRDAGEGGRSLGGESDASDSTVWHQLVITGRTPSWTTSVGEVRRECMICGRIEGEMSPYYLAQKFTPEMFDTAADIQVCASFRSRDGRTYCGMEGHFFLSHRLVELLVRARVRGLSDLDHDTGAYSALYFGEAVT